MQTNWLRFFPLAATAAAKKSTTTNNNNNKNAQKSVPWVEAPPNGDDAARADVAARRAEVEASVAKARRAELEVSIMASVADAAVTGTD